MSEHDERDEIPEESEVEAHGLREAAATGMSAAALLAAGAGAASAATPSTHASTHGAAAMQKSHLDKKSQGADPTLKIRAGDPTIKLDQKGTRARADVTQKGRESV